MRFEIEKLVRSNIQRHRPYSSARSEFTGTADVFLDANENAFGSPAGEGFNRYPDPLQIDLKNRVAELHAVAASQIFIGNGSDEAIDLLFRIFCEPGRDECVICPPTYGMYRVSAEINDVVVNEIPLTSEFQLSVPSILGAISAQTKLIFICSPNNPTGNLMSRDDVVKIADQFDGIVVVDEAYFDFANGSSMIREIGLLPNIVVLRTFSKAWGMAGLRVGLAFGSERVIALMNRVKPPYNVSTIAQQAVLGALDEKEKVDSWIANTLAERARLIEALAELPFVKAIYPSDANFILVRTDDANGIYEYLIEQMIVVRDRSNVVLCEECLRITIGTDLENDRLLDALENYNALKELYSSIVTEP
jgi:histidinol-phosphate aminotransferase